MGNWIRCAATLGSLMSLSAVALPFQNGSLESNDSGFIQTLPAGSTANGWTAVGANVEFVKTGYSNGIDTVGAAADGQWFVDLNGTQGAGAIQQSFDTLAGQWYRVSFSMSGNAGPNGTTSGGPKTLSVIWGGQSAGSASYAHLSGDNWSNLRWEPHSVLVQATGTSSQLRFQSTYYGNSAAGAFVDNIRVAPVPEPASLALMLAGLAGLGGLVAKRRA